MRTLRRGGQCWQRTHAPKTPSRAGRQWGRAFGTLGELQTKALVPSRADLRAPRRWKTSFTCARSAAPMGPGWGRYQRTSFLNRGQAGGALAQALTRTGQRRTELRLIDNTRAPRVQTGGDCTSGGGGRASLLHAVRSACDLLA